MHDYINQANILNEKNKEMKGRMNGNITNNGYAFDISAAGLLLVWMADHQ